MNTKKITRATVKSFIKKNWDRLLIKNKTNFDGMTDGIESVPESMQNFSPIETTKYKYPHPEHDFGIDGAWFVGGGRDYFRELEEEGLRGYYIGNCCGSFELAVKI